MIEPTWIDDFDEADTPWLIDGFVCPSIHFYLLDL